MIKTTQHLTNRVQKLFDEDELSQTIHYKKHPYGKISVIYDGLFLISIGPNYCCFLITFLVFCMVSALTVAFVNSNADNCTLQNGIQIVCIGQCLSYLIVALSNPGVVTQSSQDLPLSETKQCHYCQIVVPRHTKHCSECQVCIQNYDHHCPWTSKCIGGRNIIQFYIFLTMTAIFLIYLLIIAISSTEPTLQMTQNALINT